MEIIKNLEIFEKELRSIELDTIDKPDPYNNNILSKYIYASKYDKEHNLYLQFAAQFENNTPLFPFSLPPEADTYRNDLVYLSLNVFNDFLLMNDELQKGVIKRLNILRGFLFEAKNKIFKYGHMKTTKFYSLHFFNDLFASFRKVDNGIEWRNYLIEKEIADIILNAIFDRIGVLDELINVIDNFINADQKKEISNNNKKKSRKKPDADILSLFSSYTSKIEKGNSSEDALTYTAKEVDKKQDRKFFNSQEPDYNKRIKNIKDMIRRKFIEFEFIEKKTTSSDKKKI